MPFPEFSLAGVLIAGGRSRRMGADKALLAFDGEPLWRRQLRILREAGAASLLVSAPTRPPWCPAAVPAVADLPPSRGPLSGLSAALGASPSTHLLALAVDLPAMPAAHLRFLRSLARPGRGVIPLSPRGVEPLCAVYPAEAASPARAALSRGEAALQALAEELLRRRLARPYVVPESERSLYFNLNAPQDLGARGVRAPQDAQDSRRTVRLA